MANGSSDDPNSAETVVIRTGAQAGRRPGEGFVDPLETVLIPGGARPAGGSEETRVIRPGAPAASNQPASSIDPVVGFLVVIGGPGKGAFRGLFYGNNSLGRSAKERVPLDFGDDAISQTEQAFIRYDYEDRRFLFIPNLTKSNIVYLNEFKPVAPADLNPGDVIRIGQTQLRFFPVCGPGFDWSDIADQ